MIPTPGWLAWECGETPQPADVCRDEHQPPGTSFKPTPPGAARDAGQPTKLPTDKATNHNHTHKI